MLSIATYISSLMVFSKQFGAAQLQGRFRFLHQFFDAQK